MDNSNFNAALAFNNISWHSSVDEAWKLEASTAEDSEMWLKAVENFVMLSDLADLNFSDYFLSFNGLVMNLLSKLLLFSMSTE